MKTETQNQIDVRGISSRAAANRLATILLVVPRNVMAFQNDKPGHVELRTEDRCAVVDVKSTGVYVSTRVGRYEERSTFESSDKEVARRLFRFFDPATLPA